MIDNEPITKVKKYITDDKYKVLKDAEVAILCDTSASTVSRIRNGYYDKPDTDTVNVPITYDRLKRLIACEEIVNAMLREATLHENIENTLYVNNKVVFKALSTYLPDDVGKRIVELAKEVLENE